MLGGLGLFSVFIIPLFRLEIYDYIDFRRGFVLPSAFAGGFLFAFFWSLVELRPLKTEPIPPLEAAAVVGRLVPALVAWVCILAGLASLLAVRDDLVANLAMVNG